MNITTTNSVAEGKQPRSWSYGRTIAGLLWLAAATLTYCVSLWLLKQHASWSPAVRITITLVPLLPGILYLRSLLKSFWEMDELQRRIQVEGLGFALVATVLVLSALNICKAEGITLLNYPQGLGIGGIYMTMFILWSVGVSMSSFRYR